MFLQQELERVREELKRRIRARQFEYGERDAHTVELIFRDPLDPSVPGGDAAVVLNVWIANEVAHLRTYESKFNSVDLDLSQEEEAAELLRMFRDTEHSCHVCKDSPPAAPASCNWCRRQIVSTT